MQSVFIMQVRLFQGLELNEVFKWWFNKQTWKHWPLALTNGIANIMIAFKQVPQTLGQSKRQSRPKLRPLIEPVILFWAGWEAQVNSANIWKSHSVYTFQGKSVNWWLTYNCLWILYWDMFILFTFHVYGEMKGKKYFRLLKKEWTLLCSKTII